MPLDRKTKSVAPTNWGGRKLSPNRFILGKINLRLSDFLMSLVTSEKS